MRNIFPKSAIVTIAAVVIGISSLQTMSMLSVVQYSAAQQPPQTPPFNQGQCVKYFEEQDYTKEEAQDICKDLYLNQGQCIQFARDNPQSGITEEDCRDFVAEPPSTPPATPTCGGEVATIVGTEGDDINIDGTPERDVIAGLGGNDNIEGFGGDDLICGDEGDDELMGSEGDDTLYGGDGNDILNAWTGDDTLFGEDGDDVLNTVDSTVNNDRLDGGADTDTCSSDPDPEENCELD